MSSSLFKQLDCLNKDIDKCKSKVQCPPNCYCDKRIAIDQKNYVTSTRKKTATATVSKMDISPRLHQEGKCKRNLKEPVRPKTSDSEMCTKNGEVELTCYQNATSHTKYPKDINHSCNGSAEPVKLSKKCSQLKKEPSWSSILLQNNRPEVKNNLDYGYVSKKDMYTQKNSISSCSTVTSPRIEHETVYMRNRGVQCEPKPLPKNKYSNSYDPVDTMQYLIMNMKSKLKADHDLGSMLDEMEGVMRRIPYDRGDNQDVGNFATDYLNSLISKNLHPKPQLNQKLHVPDKQIRNLEATYQELEATCAKLKKERDTAIEKASQKSAELVESMRREVETKVKLTETNLKIKEMSTKLETYTKSMEGLTEHVKRLQHENKDIERIKQQVHQLSGILRNVTQENKSLLSDLQQVTVERNKLEVELAIKEQNFERKTKELENMSLLVLDKSKCSPEQRTSLEFNQENVNLISSSNHRQTYEIHPGNIETSHSSPQLITSSPNTSSDSILQTGFKSWIDFSTIPSNGNKVENELQFQTQIIDNPVQSINPINNDVNQNCNIIQQSHVEYQQTYPSNLTSNRQPDLNKIEKLKEEIRRMFSEMRELAKDVPSLAVVEIAASSVGGDSSDINWSDLSNTVNVYDSISDSNSSDLNEIMSNGRIKH